MIKIYKPVIQEIEDEVIINHPDDLYTFALELYKDVTVEEFIVIALDTSHKVISARVISIGTINRTIVHPREVFRNAILDNAAALIVCHNHPSGNSYPSDEDVETTKVLIEASKIIGIEILDHMILGYDYYYSFLEHNNLFGDEK